MQDNDINQVFDQVTFFEAENQDKGQHYGYKHGCVVGYLEGCKLGSVHGTKLGSELGFYSGFAHKWASYLSELDTNAKEQKILTTLKDLIELVDNFPSEDPQNIAIEESLLKIRAKFKKASSLLNITEKHTNKQDMSF